MDIAARVKANQSIITIHTHPQYVEAAKRALKVGGDKLPTPYKIKIERGKDVYDKFVIKKKKEV
jgi:ribosomal protein L16/L10AE